MLLRIEEVDTFYGAIQALRSLSMEVATGEITTLIGANGAGKSTLLMTICGVQPARHGRILFDGEDITHVPTAEIVRRGVALAPEGRRIFPGMTVIENLQMGALANEQGLSGQILDEVFDLFPRLKEREKQRGGTLSGGEQQMLAIGRALMSAPRLLLLDEPSLGLAPLLVRQIFDAIRKINAERNITVLLIEQNAYQALRVANRAHVIVNGAITLSGPATDLINNQEVRASYLEGA